MVSEGDSLTELPKLVGIQNVAELRLSDQDNLHQFFFIGFQIRQQP